MKKAVLLISVLLVITQVSAQEYTTSNTYPSSSNLILDEFRESDDFGNSHEKLNVKNNSKRELGIPFSEGWDSGGFELNNWSTQAGESNWSVNGMIGNQAPSARFNRFPDPGANYSIILKSDSLNASLLSEGHIWLDFQLKLNDINANGSEKMTVQIYDGTVWHSIYECANAGSFDWDSIHLDITSYSKGKVFQLSFEANGANSQNIQNWYIDNIEVYRDCPSACDLEILYDTAISGEIYFHFVWEWGPCDKNKDKFINSNRSLVGWNLYRSINGSPFELYASIPFDIGWGYYIPWEPSDDLYCYQWTNIWAGEIDICESAPFKSKENPEEDFVCVMTVGVNENINSKSNSINIYPNPAEDVVYLQAEEEILNAEIMNSMGQVLIAQNGKSKKMQFETSNLQQGIYFVRIQFEKTTVSQKLVIRNP